MFSMFMQICTCIRRYVHALLYLDNLSRYSIQTASDILEFCSAVRDMHEEHDILVMVFARMRITLWRRERKLATTTNEPGLLRLRFVEAKLFRL